MNKRWFSLGLLISASSCDGNVKHKLWFSKMGRGGFLSDLFSKRGTGCLFRVLISRRCGVSTILYAFFSPALVGLVSLF